MEVVDCVSCSTMKGEFESLFSLLIAGPTEVTFDCNTLWAELFFTNFNVILNNLYQV